jgi:hypothetical protein
MFITNRKGQRLLDARNPCSPIPICKNNTVTLDMYASATTGIDSEFTVQWVSKLNQDI